MDRPNLLFISPVLPRPTGGGICMRAYWTLRTLSSRHRVTLVHGSPSHDAQQPRADDAVDPLCEAVVRLPTKLLFDPRLALRRATLRLSPALSAALYRQPSDLVPLTRPIKRVLDRVLDGVTFETLHLFRLAMLPVCEYIMDRFGWRFCQLDLDDIESTTRERIGALHRRAGETSEADRCLRDAARYRALEHQVASQFDRLFVASEEDKQWLERVTCTDRVTVLPNVIALPEHTARRRLPATSGPFCLVFVGSLGYLPNLDGILFFCNEVLPLLRRMVARSIVVRVVGRGSTGRLNRALAPFPGVALVGAVDNVTPVYTSADAVIAPLRAGGGTRIKILEAMAHCRPVVSTTLGIEGLGVTREQHLLVGDDAEEFAAQCARLMDDRLLGVRLAQRAREYIERNHDPDLLVERLAPESGSA